MRPSAQTLDWVERVAMARVVAWRRMTGGIGSVVHRLSISPADFDSGRCRVLAVLFRGALAERLRLDYQPRLVKPSIPGGTYIRSPRTATNGTASSQSRRSAARPSIPPA
jgi:hypothetical protein